MKTVRYLFALSAFLLMSQAAYGMYYPDQSMYYIDENYLMYNGICYQYQQLSHGGLGLQPVSAYQVYPTYQMYPAYPPAYLPYPIAQMVPQNTGFPVSEPLYSTELAFPHVVERDQTDADVKKFFREIISDQDLYDFAQKLLRNAHRNDAIELVYKGAQYRSGPKPIEKKPTPPDLRRASQLKEKVFMQYFHHYNEEVQARLQELFCNPLLDDNLIKLSNVASSALELSEGEVEIICILSLALFTSFKIFNGIDRLRWAVKKGLWQLTEKTLREGIHPNWVVERGGMTAFRTSVVNGDHNITDLLLNIHGVDTTSYENNYQARYEQNGHSNDIAQMETQMKNLLTLSNSQG